MTFGLWVLDILGPPPQNIENLGKAPISSREMK
jgi:hypothetical protein